MEKEEKPLGVEIRLTGNMIKNFIDQTIQANLKENITGIEGMVLGYIFHHDDHEITSKDVMERNRASKATTSQTLNNLAKKGYLAMSPSSIDHRKKIITLTPKGIEVENEFKEIFKEISIQVRKGITLEDEANVKRILKLIRSNVTTEGK
jgi:MarR family transcriptional regulator, repressor for mepA